MSEPFTIRIFVPDGDPEGVKIVEQLNWTGVGVAFPRLEWPRLRKRAEFGRAGVYESDRFLFKFKMYPFHVRFEQSRFFNHGQEETRGERRPARRRRPLIRPAHIPMQCKLSPVAGFLLSALLYCGVTAVFFHYNLPTLTTELIGPPEDNMQDLWNTWYSQQLSSLRVADWFFTNRIFYPEGTSLLYHSFAYSDLAIMRLVRFLFGLPLTIPVLIALNNITLLASFIFAGLAMYIVTYHFTRNFAAA